MNAYKVNAVVTEQGLAILNGLPLPVGSLVEVIVLDNKVNGQITENIADGNRSPIILEDKSIDLASLEYLRNVSSLMNEWESAADEFAYQNL